MVFLGFSITLSSSSNLMNFITFVRSMMKFSKDFNGGRTRCLAAIACWDELSNLCKEQWNAVELAAQHEMALMAASVVGNVGECDKMSEYISKLVDGDESKLHIIDSDVAVVDNLGHIFQKYPQFHLAFTFQNNKDQPLNLDFIATRGTQDEILMAKIFLQKVLDVYVSKYITASCMLGDQSALASVVKSHFPLAAKRFSRTEAFSSEINGASVLFFTCALYNWTSPEGAGQFHGMPLDVQILLGSTKPLGVQVLESRGVFSETK